MKILYIRNHASKVNLDTYNLQEIGFSKALVDKGYDCDVVYYNDEKNIRVEEIYSTKNNKLNILWVPAIKILDNGIYLRILNKKFIDKYDIVITTEYTQLMTYLLTYLCNEKLVLYQGPYKDQDKEFIHKIYDKLFINRIRKIKNIYCKSTLCKEYLSSKKKFENANLLGVGLDINKLITDEKLNNIEANYIKDKAKNKKILLYIGRLEERRNIKFLLDVFKYILDKNENMCLVIIGDGNDKDKERYFKYIEDKNLTKDIIYYRKISQKNIKSIYEIADIFVLPTLYEIFGMVLLECMYFGLPAITSINGGSSMLIENNESGIIMNEFNVKQWADSIVELLDNKDKYQNMSKAAKLKIENNFTWTKISNEFIENLILENKDEKKN